MEKRSSPWLVELFGGLFQTRRLLPESGCHFVVALHAEMKSSSYCTVPLRIIGGEVAACHTIVILFQRQCATAQRAPRLFPPHPLLL